MAFIGCILSKNLELGSQGHASIILEQTAIWSVSGAEVIVALPGA